ncbi:hypothetical protein [Streptomyces sp. NPDC052114]|uniref:hypothetical protein n=1 Tax=unclassified Streptomyces TaxID=2593676 RepID=UPI003440AC7A
MGTFTGRAARLSVGNDGEEPLELTVEPWAEVDRVPPKETRVVVTHSSAADGSWSGTAHKDEPFHVDHRPGLVAVWANGDCFHLLDAQGNETHAYDHHCPARRPAG